MQATGDARGNGPRGTRGKPRHYGPVPKLTADSWTLTVCGETFDGGIHVLTWDQVRRMPRRQVNAAVVCAEGDLTTPGLWGGVPVSEVLEVLPPAPGVTSVLASAAYGFSSTVRLADLQVPEALLAFKLDGDPLPPEHGGPMRLLVPHLFGYKNVKWLLELSYRTVPEPGFWESRGYHMIGEVASGLKYGHQG